jgi:hypothetical protein
MKQVFLQRDDSGHTSIIGNMPGAAERVDLVSLIFVFDMFHGCIVK